MLPTRLQMPESSTDQSANLLRGRVKASREAYPSERWDGLSLPQREERDEGLFRTSVSDDGTYGTKKPDVVEGLVKMRGESGRLGPPVIGAAREPRDGDHGRRLVEQIMHLQ